ncbi:uncharacterized protein VTP21DRAFT_1531 [Calcarisporiella thermophila]|uniref:uncharacterized protein n=1 Tax=Calcarisporiella thermophila TaxID=911321 RepID=UPI0037447738
MESESNSPDTISPATPVCKSTSKFTHEHRILLRTLLRSYGIGYLAATIPRILGVLIRLRKSPSVLLRQILRILLNGLLGTNGVSPYALFSSIIFGGYTYLELLLKQRNHIPIDLSKARTLREWTHTDIGRTFVSAWLSAAVGLAFLKRRIDTAELTTFAMVRGLDVLAHMAYHSPRVRRYIPGWLLEHGDTAAMVLSCQEVMYAWFYEPNRLPKSYSKWITNMADMDVRLLEALRLMRKGKIRYRQRTGFEEFLCDYAEERGMPRDLANTILHDQVSCRVVHGGLRGGCEVHAAYIWGRGFIKSLGIYLPVHLLPSLLFRHRKFVQNPIDSLRRVLLGSFRSSSFLATFIMLSWYGVCLIRSRVGPVLGLKYDGLEYAGVVLGTWLCGLSVLIENKHRRGEMALYVANRALLTNPFMSRVLAVLQRHQPVLYRIVREGGEIGLFASGLALALTALRYNEKMVRPTIRGFLKVVLE